MTLVETIRAIEAIASAQPSVNMIVENDIFRLNAAPAARYGVFGWLQREHRTGSATPLIDYSFTFFYVDRLTEDQGNQIEVQSVGIQTLDNVVRSLDEAGLLADSDWTFTTFNQRFLDECAGVFCNVTLRVPLDDNCAEHFLGDFNMDFSDDFYIY